MVTCEDRRRRRRSQTGKRMHLVGLFETNQCPTVLVPLLPSNQVQRQHLCRQSCSGAPDRPIHPAKSHVTGTDSLESDSDIDKNRPPHTPKCMPLPHQHTNSPLSGGAVPSAPCTLHFLLTTSGIKSPRTPLQVPIKSLAVVFQSHTSN